jgi:site-specific DNA-cytosine methylase
MHRSTRHAELQKSIEGIKANDKLINGKTGSEQVLWLMSPPCQPFTRLGNQKDDQDNRSASLLHLINLLPELINPPTYILLENVKGFDVCCSSACRNHLYCIVLHR